MAKKSKNLIAAEYMATRAVLWLLGVLPRGAAIRISIAILRLLPFFMKGLWRTGMKNLEIAFPEKTITERETILNGTFENLGRVLGELSQVHKLTRAKLTDIIDFEMDEQTRAAYAENKSEGRGVVVITGHMGNWELQVLGFAAVYEPISYLARPLDNPKIDDLLTERRTMFGNTPINKTNSATLAIKILRKGGILGILADVNAQRKAGVFVPFFGLAACTSSGAAMLAIRTKALIYPTFCIWDAVRKKYKVVNGKLLEPVITDNRKQDIIDTTALYTAEIEKVIRAYPEQWMWIHKRWKTRPKGEPEIY